MHMFVCGCFASMRTQGCGKRAEMWTSNTPVPSATRVCVVGVSWTGSGRCVSKIPAHACEQIGQRIAARERDPDFARGDGDACSDLEQLEPDGVALRLGHIRVFQPQPAKS